MKKRSPKISVGGRRENENLISYLFLLPWLSVLFIFTLYPFVEGIVISFYDYSLKSRTFVGLENFRKILMDPAFKESIIVTLQMNLIIIPGTVIFSLMVAYAIHDLPPWAKNLVKVVFYISCIISTVALVMVWKWMFNPGYGLYKTLCQKFGWLELDLLGDYRFSIPLISVLVLSFTVSQPIVLFSAAMDSVPASYYEAAELDGASRFRQFITITMPMISNATILVLVTTTINNLQVFTVPKLLTGGGPVGHTTPVLLHIYRTAFEYGKYGYASAMGVILFLIIGFFVAVQFILQRKEDDWI